LISGISINLRAVLAAVTLLSFAAAADAALPLQSEQGIPTLAPLMEKVTPAVVNISVLSRSPAEQNPLFRDPFFRRFFELPEQPQPQMSAGSGVIVDAAKGYVLTNYHVVENATEIVVTLKDRRRLKAKLVGSDHGTDIALLHIEAGNLTALPFGDSDKLRVGDFVAAIGNPFGLGQTVTSGIVSALGRSGINIEGYEDFIQTDASINPGNSGGALVDLKGELVGINTAIIGPTGGNVGIGFAVPSNMARTVMDQLARYGAVRRGRLGIVIQDLTPELAKGLGTAQSEGAVITQIEPGSPADKGGIRVGDVVVEVNGHHVRSSADLRNRIGLVRVGEKVELIVYRDGKRKIIDARVVADTVSAADSGVVERSLGGATFHDIDPGMPQYGKIEGVLVANVDAGSPAWQHGVRPGDIVIGVNQQRVKNVEDLKQALATVDRAISLELLRGTARIVLVIR
jgi:Do/DeqQ family serine protease